MGRPDQLAKRVLREETPVVTGHHVAFEVPSEVPVGALQPDGVVRVVRAPGLLALCAPWSRLRVEATLDVKMPGDHVDRAALARCELRRHARWAQHLESLRAQPRDAAAPRDPPDPRDFDTWVVAPHLPQWLRDDAARGFFALDEVAPGCWRIALGVHETLWIAANDLPLRVELLPLLVARSGAAQGEFLLWSAQVRGLDWTLELIKDLPMASDTASEFLSAPVDDESQRRIKTEFTRKLLEFYPDAANQIRQAGVEEGIEQGVEQGIEQGVAKGLLQMLAMQFAQRLGRALTDAERAVLDERVRTMGVERLGRAVLDLDAEALSAWMHDPHAT